jgi:hypothetical protein
MTSIDRDLDKLVAVFKGVAGEYIRDVHRVSGSVSTYAYLKTQYPHREPHFVKEELSTALDNLMSSIDSINCCLRAGDALLVRLFAGYPELMPTIPTK